MLAPNYAMLILKLHRFLRERPMNETELKRQEQLLLAQGMEFLRRALAGYKLITGPHYLVPDVVPLATYSFANQALRSIMSFPSDENERQLLEEALQILEQLTNGVPLAQIPCDTLEEVRHLFKRLSIVALSEPIDDNDSLASPPDLPLIRNRSKID